MVVVIGGGHVGKAVAHLAKWLGFRVAISDDRVEFCSPEVNPDGDEYYACPMAELPLQLSITPHTYLVLTTRGNNVDIAGLPALLETPADYIGVIGSKRRWSETVKSLNEVGITDDQLKRVHSPIGLGIGAETPEEIAVSIMAEILMLKGGGSGQQMKNPR
jgi:xanthine dehydrogenase accessory factor